MVVVEMTMIKPMIGSFVVLKNGVHFALSKGRATRTQTETRSGKAGLRVGQICIPVHPVYKQRSRSNSSHSELNHSQHNHNVHTKIKCIIAYSFQLSDESRYICFIQTEKLTKNITGKIIHIFKIVLLFAAYILSTYKSEILYKLAPSGIRDEQGNLISSYRREKLKFHQGYLAIRHRSTISLLGIITQVGTRCSNTSSRCKNLNWQHLSATLSSNSIR